MTLLGQVPGSELDINSIISGGGFAVFTVFIFYLTMKFYPSLIDTFRQDIKEQRASNEKIANTISASITQQGNEITSTLQELESVQRQFGEMLVRHETKMDAIHQLKHGNN